MGQVAGDSDPYTDRKGQQPVTSKEEFCNRIRLCERAMYALALSIVRNESDAEDVTAESVYLAYRSLYTLKNDDAFKPWILRIVRNTAVELIRKNSRLIPTEEITDIPAENSTGDVETKLTLRDAVERLKQPYRTATILYYYENLSVSNISHITGTSAVTVKKQLSRARMMLRESLKEDFN